MRGLPVVVMLLASCALAVTPTPTPIPWTTDGVAVLHTPTPTPFIVWSPHKAPRWMEHDMVLVTMFDCTRCDESASGVWQCQCVWPMKARELRRSAFTPTPTPTPTPKSEPKVGDQRKDGCNTCTYLGSGAWICTSLGCGYPPRWER